MAHDRAAGLAINSGLGSVGSGRIGFDVARGGIGNGERGELKSYLLHTFNGPLRGAVGIGYAVKVVYHSGREKLSQGHLEGTIYWGIFRPIPQDADRAESGRIGGRIGAGDRAGSGRLNITASIIIPSLNFRKGVAYHGGAHHPPLVRLSTHPPFKNWTCFQLVVHSLQHMAEISVKKNLTGETLDMFLNKLSLGISITGACGACGISPSRLDKLRKEKPKLNAQVLAAQAQAEEALCRKVMESRDGKLALAFLQSRFPQWNQKTTKSDNQSAPSTISPELLSQLSSIPERVKTRN